MKSLHKLKILISVLFTGLVIFGFKKGYDLAAPQYKEKLCNYIYPEDLNTLLITPHKDFELLSQKGGTVNDASCLNETQIYGVVKVRDIEDIRTTINFAKNNDLKITSAGQKHSMGGQAFSKGGLVLDMRNFNKIEVDETNKTVKVQSGATWKQVQQELDKVGLSVKSMQSINILTVGGALSVNAHGIVHNPGQVASTVKSFRLMLHDGTVLNVSRTENSELFSLALGGYGLFGVILDADLEVTDNEAYRWETTYMDYKEFPEYYKNNVAGNGNIPLMYGRVSVSPTEYLTTTSLHTFTRTNIDSEIPPMKEDSHNWVTRFVINFSKTGSFGRWFRWIMEKNIESRIHECISRNQAMGQKEVCIVSRNQEMSQSMSYLKNNLKDTDILQEYFIPKEKTEEFIDGMRNIVIKNNANLLNVTIRGVTDDSTTALPYSKGDNFAFVLYFNQKLNNEESKILEATTSDLIDLAISLSGRYYLPYQLYYSPEQLKAAYPEVNNFFKLKKKYDPQEIFTNKFYEKYKEL